jgi:membrane protease YdiL (CAAX protease family)
MMRAKFLFLIEVLVIATVFHLDYLGLLPVSKNPYLFALAWISIRLRGLRWKDVGLRTTAPEPLLKIFVIGVLVGLAMEALELFATQPFLTKLLGRGPDLEQLRPLIGNWKLLILGIALSWTLAAFAEETIYRGYLTNRVAEIFGRSKSAWFVAAILVTLLFALAHFPQGPTGIIENIIDGAILAALYFATGRNLWAPIIAHGIQDSVDVLLIYFGAYPGLSPATMAAIT